MSTFALDVNSAPGDIITGLNYALSNLGQGSSISSLGNVLVANVTTGEVTTTTSGGDTTIVQWLYPYMNVKYANSSTGGSGFSSNSQYRSYYGIHNSNNTSISSNPVDYQWFQVTGGFGASKSLWYQTIGGRQISFFPSITAPASDFISVPDDTALNLDTITAAQNNQFINVSAYLQGNTTPATPSGGTYSFPTFTLTPPSGWSATIPAFVANTNVYISQAAFVGNTATTNAGPSTTWTVPVVYAPAFNGNTGPTGERGFVPLGFVVVPSDPTSASDATLTGWFSASRGNSSAPIGLGYAPIDGDTAQFFYQDLFDPNGDVTLVKSFDGTNWSTVTAEVMSGGLIVPGTITANTLNANQVYAITVQSTNANIGDNNSNGYWFQANTGNGRFGGNLNIGNNLTIGDNAVIGGNLNVTGLITQGNLGNAVVTSDNIQAAAITSVKIALDSVSGDQIKAATINGTNIAPNTITGNLITASTITGNLIAASTITGNLITANTITGNLITANTIQGNSIIAGSITATELAANVLVVGNINSTGSTLNDPNATGYWLNNLTGNVRFGGNTSIGNNLLVGNNAVIGGFATVGSNVTIGGNLTVGANARIGGNLTVTGLVTAGNLNSSTVATTTIVTQAVSTGQGTSSSTPLNTGGTIAGTYYPYTACNLSLTTTTGLAQIFVQGILYFAINTMSPTNCYFVLFRSGTGGTVPLFTFLMSTVPASATYSIPFNYFDVVNPGTYTYQIGAYWNGSGSNGTFAFKAGTLVLQQLKR